MMQLGRRQINRVWTEAGATLAGALLTKGLVDELVLYTAPKLLGDDARGLCHLPGIERLPTRRALPLATLNASVTICG